MHDGAKDTLEAIRHSMYTRAERWWWVALGLVVLGVIAASIAVRPWTPAGSLFNSVAVLVSICAPVLAAFARWRSGTYAARADLCRRAFLYRDALGENLSIEEQRILALWPANTPLNKVTTLRPYFSSGEPTGPARLADAVGESAFFSAELARVMASAGVGMVVCAGLTIASALNALSSLSLDAPAMSNLQIVVGMVATVTLALLLGEILITAWTYRALANASESAFRSAAQFAALPNKTVITAIRIAESYSIALAANLPIPDFLYRWHHDRIDLAYRHALTVKSRHGNAP